MYICIHLYKSGMLVVGIEWYVICLNEGKQKENRLNAEPHKEL